MKENNKDKFVYEAGDIEVHALQCKNCIFKLSSPLTCKKYLGRKPSDVLKCSSRCSYYKEIN